MSGSIPFAVVCVCLFGLAVAVAQRWWVAAFVLGAILWAIGMVEWWRDDDAHDTP